MRLGHRRAEPAERGLDADELPFPSTSPALTMSPFRSGSPCSLAAREFNDLLNSIRRACCGASPQRSAKDRQADSTLDHRRSKRGRHDSCSDYPRRSIAAQIPPTGFITERMGIVMEP